MLLNANTGTFTELFKPGGPCIAPMRGENELLVCKGNVGLILGQDGRVSRRGSLTWSDLPLTLTASHPYAIALLPNYVEIRSVHRISANGLAQVSSREALTADRYCPFCARILPEIWCNDTRAQKSINKQL